MRTIHSGKCCILHNLSIEDNLHDFEVPLVPELAQNVVIIGQDVEGEHQDDRNGIIKINEVMNNLNFLI